jgi:GNAT superfamily N-acetyltransferase
MKKQPKQAKHRLEYQPVTSARLKDLRAFSECHGTFRYCSCMRWRMPSTEYKRSSKQERAAGLDERVRREVPVGVLAYANGEPVGWCSIAPRETCQALERYRKLARIDEAPVWSVVCFFVDARFRRQGLRQGLLKAAVLYARSCGAKLVEGYPGEPGGLYGYMGSAELFKAAGFRDVTPSGRERRVFRVG